MELLIVRHAPAEDRLAAAAAGRADSRRELTPRGERRMKHAVRGLVALELRCALVLHSPWRRAAHTAMLLAPIADGATRRCAALARAPDERLLAELVRATASLTRDAEDERAGGAPRFALVGHQPWMGELVAWLCTGETEAGAALRFGKGTVAHLVGEPEPGGMELAALLPARTLRQLGLGARRRERHG